jgi:hypothetical protein
MNCKNFETIIVEMARGQMLEARVLESANAHMELCKACAARYADELALTGGLHSMAASVMAVETPDVVEAALLNAFRQRAANAHAHAFAAPSARRNNPRRWNWSVAAAAAFVVMAAVTSLSLLRSGSPALTTVANNAPPQTAVPVAATPFQEEPEPGADPIVRYTGGQQRPGRRPAFIPAANTGRGVSRTASQNALTAQTAAMTNSDTSAVDEISTDFLPLTHGSSLAQMDDGQIVRVELPRSALQSFGLPMNAERAGERVKADVLLGYDGVARAIRFVK